MPHAAPSKAKDVISRVGLSEVDFLKVALGFLPECEDGVAERLTPGIPTYQANVNAEFEKFVNGTPSAVYLGYQPIWNSKTRVLVGLEVLCRVKNGRDAAPMPGLAVFQTTQKHNALKFLHAQCDFAVLACQRLPNIWVSVNVRPDELAGSKDKLIDCAKSNPNFVVEVTEYAPIQIAELALLKDMTAQGVTFTLDDVTEVQDAERPAKCFANSSKHACSFQLGMEHPELFKTQKLATPLACSVWRVHVFPTPEFAGGTPEPFLKGCIFPEDKMDEIRLRTQLVDEWVSTVQRKRPDTAFVMECTVYPTDLAGKQTDLFPACGIFDGMLIQGGQTGGRVFPLEAFCTVNVLKREG